MTLANPEGFRFGFELEVNMNAYDSVGGDKRMHIINAMNEDKHAFSDDILWTWTPDGEGPEFKTDHYFEDLNKFMNDIQKLTYLLKQNDAHVTEKLSPKWRKPNEYFGVSPRGIHFHVSHPHRLIKRDRANREEMNALKLVPITKAGSRQHYCIVRVHESKYSAVHIVNRTRLEVRAYNATLNVRGIAWMLQNAQKIARIMFH